MMYKPVKALIASCLLMGSAWISPAAFADGHYGWHGDSASIHLITPSYDSCPNPRRDYRDRDDRRWRDYRRHRPSRHLSLPRCDRNEHGCYNPYPNQPRFHGNHH